MNKILLVARREFLSRVQKKTFLLTTILLPLIIFGFYAMIIYFSVKTGSNTKIAVADEANIFNKIDCCVYTFIQTTVLCSTIITVSTAVVFTHHHRV